MQRAHRPNNYKIMKKNYSKIKILLVDDDEQYANKLKKAIEALEFSDTSISDSYVVNIFTDANKAIEAYYLSKYDVFITDVSLKNTPQYIENGHNLIAKLLKRSSIKNLCIIFISAVNLYGADETAKILGGNFIEKDKNIDQLAFRICLHIAKFKFGLREVYPKKSKDVIVDLVALQINITKNHVLFNDEIIKLSPAQSRLLMELAKQYNEDPNSTITHEDMLNVYSRGTLSLETAKDLGKKNNDGFSTYKYTGSKVYNNVAQQISMINKEIRKSIGLDKTLIINDKKYGFRLQYILLSKNKRR